MRVTWLIMAALLAGGAIPSAAQAVQDESAPYFVFFNWGTVDVARDWEANIDEAVAAYQADPNGVEVLVTGYSDRSGPTGVNRRISERRARAVAKALQDRGIPEAAIRIDAAGEGQTLIVTEDGVREAQNRRVEIILSKN